jgi:type III secretion protein V
VRGLLSRYSDLALAALVVAIVGMMIVPLPTPLLDLLIAVNIATGVVLLLVAIYVSDALKIATFPTLLLLTTLFRLALEVSATRLILLHADGGEVIRAFGNFVVAGNLVVGAVIFLILTMIQFIVISKGSERVAEVAARFTLDAMPGKQMSIDAELRAGHIGHDEARRRRAALARESQLFGSMDGAMKFVKGDAIAGIVVLAVNIIGGLIIGIVQRGMDAGAAARTYTVLTIGEGLVAQIPALIISTSAGIIVTRVASEEEGGHLGRDIGLQVMAQPKAIADRRRAADAAGDRAGVACAAVSHAGRGARAGRVAAAARAPLAARAGAATGGAAATATTGAGDGGPRAQHGGASRRYAAATGADPIAVEVGARAGRATGPARAARWRRRRRVRDRGGAAAARADVCRAGPAAAAGAPPSGRGGPAAHGVRHPRQRGAAGARREIARDALPARRRACTTRSRPSCGATVTSCSVWKRRRALLDALERTHPALVREVVPKLISPVLLTDVLRRLVEEGISLRNLRDILGALAEWAPQDRDPVALTEHVRVALRRAITYKHAGDAGVLAAYLLDPMIEDAIREVDPEDRHGQLPGAGAADLSRQSIAAVGRAIGPTGAAGAVLLTGVEIRRYVRRLIEGEHPGLPVLSFQELAPEAQIRPIARISVG